MTISLGAPKDASNYQSVSDGLDAIGESIEDFDFISSTADWIAKDPAFAGDMMPPTALDANGNLGYASWGNQKPLPTMEDLLSCYLTIAQGGGNNDSEGGGGDVDVNALAVAVAAQIGSSQTNRGWINAVPDASSAQILSAINYVKGSGSTSEPRNPTTLIDMGPAGLAEIWCFGQTQKLLRLNHDGEILSVIDTYQSPNQNNNGFRAFDACIDWAQNLLIVACYNWHVVRVYDLAAFTSSPPTFSKSGSQTNGHLYDIGSPNPSGSNWLNANTPRTGESGALYLPTAVCIDTNGDLIISNYLGDATATSTGNWGFIVKYEISPTAATFKEIVAAYDGTSNSGSPLFDTRFRRPYGKVRQVPNSSKLSVPTLASISGYGHYEIDSIDPASGGLTEYRTPPAGYSTSDWRVYDINYDSAGNRYYCAYTGTERGVVAADSSNNYLWHVGVSVSANEKSIDAFRFDSPRCICFVENAATTDDWMMIPDYSGNSISLIPRPDGMGSGLPNDVGLDVPFIEIGVDFVGPSGVAEEIPAGWIATNDSGDWVLDSPNQSLKVVAQCLPLPVDATAHPISIKVEAP